MCVCVCACVCVCVYMCVVVIVGGMDLTVQAMSLAKKPHIIIGEIYHLPTLMLFYGVFGPPSGQSALHMQL